MRCPASSAGGLRAVLHAKSRICRLLQSDVWGNRLAEKPPDLKVVKLQKQEIEDAADSRIWNDRVESHSTNHCATGDAVSLYDFLLHS
jgi:hypothetical protein